MVSQIKPGRIGFLGVGAVAINHAEAINALGHSVVAGCATSIESSRWRTFQSVAPNARFESNASQLLSADDIDAVVACLPWNITEGCLPQLLATNKPVLIEKPAALSTQALSNAMCSKAEHLENKWVGFNRRYYGTVQRLRERVLEGGMKSAEVVISETVDRISDKFGADILDHLLAYSSCHLLDTSMFVLGRLQPMKIYPHEEKGYVKPFRSFNALLENPQGVPVFLSVLADNPSPVGIRIFFDDRTTWHLSPVERLTAYLGYDRTEATAEVKVPRYSPKPFLETEEDASLRPGFVAQMRSFVDGDGQEHAATLADSLQLLELVESLQRGSAG